MKIPKKKLNERLFAKTFSFCAIGFFSNGVTDKKVQLNTDLLKPRHGYLYRKRMAWLKLNEIRGLFKTGSFLLFWEKMAEEVLAVRHFYKLTVYKNLMKVPKVLEKMISFGSLSPLLLWS
jgi:hypothetical protein